MSYLLDYTRYRVLLSAPLLRTLEGVGGGYRNRTDLNSCLQGKRPPHADPSPILLVFTLCTAYTNYNGFLAALPSSPETY